MKHDEVTDGGEWLSLSEIKGEIDDDDVRRLIFEGKIHLRGCYVYDRSLGLNTSSDPAPIRPGIIRQCLRPELNGTLFQRKINLDIDNGILYFDEYDTLDDSQVNYAFFIELEFQRIDLTSYLSKNSARGRPLVHDWDLMRKLVSELRDQIVKCEYLSSACKIIENAYSCRTGKPAPERRSMERVLREDIRPLLKPRPGAMRSAKKRA